VGRRQSFRPIPRELAGCRGVVVVAVHAGPRVRGTGRVFIGNLLTLNNELVIVFGVHFISFLAVHRCTAGNPVRGYAESWRRGVKALKG